MMKLIKVCLHVCLLFIFLLAGCTGSAEPAPNGEVQAKVKRVVDGDTFEVENGAKVRMIGVDTPESVKPNHPVEPYGKEASNFTKRLLTGKEVTLKFDVEPKDRYGRWLAYVYLQDGTFVNELLVREGYAQVMTIPPNVAHQELFLQAQREARENNRGLWGLQESKPEPEQLPGSGKIKGNINSKGEKIYHLPGSRGYEQTKPEAWFETEEEARAAGFRPAK